MISNRREDRYSSFVNCTMQAIQWYRERQHIGIDASHLASSDSYVVRWPNGLSSPTYREAPEHVCATQLILELEAADHPFSAVPRSTWKVALAVRLTSGTTMPLCVVADDCWPDGQDMEHTPWSAFARLARRQAGRGTIAYKAERSTDERA